MGLLLCCASHREASVKALQRLCRIGRTSIARLVFFFFFFGSQRARQKLLQMAPKAIDPACVHQDFPLADASGDGKQALTVITGCVREMKLLTESIVDSGPISDEDVFAVGLRASCHSIHCSHIPLRKGRIKIYERLQDITTASRQTPAHVNLLLLLTTKKPR